tara:strand:- start:414 stop:944 length:531 start_codon:yes stop_codon:yes gene_type:complete
MSKLTDSQPTNLNQLNVVSFDISFSRLPGVQYFCQRISLPTVVLGETNEPSPFLNVPLEGDTLTFEAMSLSFIVDEDLLNYREIYDWMTALGFPREYGQFAALQEQSTGSTLTKYSDLTIVLHTNKSNPNYKIKFTDCFPTSLSSIQFDSTPTGMDPIVVDATFNFRGMFDITKVV